MFEFNSFAFGFAIYECLMHEDLKTFWCWVSMFEITARIWTTVLPPLHPTQGPQLWHDLCLQGSKTSQGREGCWVCALWLWRLCKWWLIATLSRFCVTVFLLVWSPGMAFVVVTCVVKVGKILGRPIEEGWDLFVFSYDPHEQAMYVKCYLFTDKLKLIETGSVGNQNSCVKHFFHSFFQNLTMGLLNNKQTWLV